MIGQTNKRTDIKTELTTLHIDHRFKNGRINSLINSESIFLLKIVANLAFVASFFSG